MEVGIEPILFEKDSFLGGIWFYENNSNNFKKPMIYLRKMLLNCPFAILLLIGSFQHSSFKTNFIENAYETLVTNTCSRMMEFGDFPYSKYNKNGKQPEYLTHQQVKILKILADNYLCST